MTTTGIAPVKAPLAVPCGADFVVQVSFVDDVTGNPINVSTPKAQVRTDQFPTATLVLTPTVAAAGNVVTVTFPSALTKALFSQRGYWDVFAVRTDTGQEVKLAGGSLAFTAAVTAL